jgi:DNA repair protein RadD
MSLQLRDHQSAVIDGLREGFKEGHRSQLLYAPTGFGKTEVAIHLMEAVAAKYKSAAIVLDRLVLVEQTSQRLNKYGLDHGVFQSEHWRYRPYEKLQVCSAQTLERRDDFPKVDLLIVDECHIARKQTTEYIHANPEVKVVGLTATPFTKGLGLIYSNVITGATTGWLVDNKWLTPLRVYIAKEIDMTGAKKIAGEWSNDVVTERGLKLVGDIVAEWVTKTMEIFGKPEKTIVFCAGVAHGAALVQKFAERGYNFVSISYKDDDDFKKAAIEDFSKPDTQIHGLIATDILTRGFDVSDVKIGVSARPFSKSFSAHVQQMGRVMRPYEGKDFALWLDHSGNYLRFRKDWDKLYVDGVNTLDKIVDKAHKEPTEREKKESKCPSCGYLWPARADTCPACGHVRQRRNEVVAIPGVLEELLQTSRGQIDEKQKFYSELLYIAIEKNYQQGWVKHKYREKFGVWPRNMREQPEIPSYQTVNWVTHRNMAYAKRQQKYRRLDR